jgi:hypothetical protein
LPTAVKAFDIYCFPRCLNSIWKPIEAAHRSSANSDSGTINQSKPPGMGDAVTAQVFLIACCLMLALVGCSTKPIDILCPPAGVCPNTQSGHGGGY